MVAPACMLRQRMASVLAELLLQPAWKNPFMQAVQSCACMETTCHGNRDRLQKQPVAQGREECTDDVNRQTAAAAATTTKQHVETPVAWPRVHHIFQETAQQGT